MSVLLMSVLLMGGLSSCKDSESGTIDGTEHEDLVCPDDETACAATPEAQSADECANLDTDADHCGECLNACGDAQICNAGQCEDDPQNDTCENDTVDCDNNDVCIDLQTDADHCGECHNACDGLSRCYEGECVQLCPKGYSTCGAGCCPPSDYCGDEDTAQCLQINCLIGTPCGQTCCQLHQSCRAADVCDDICLPDETICGADCCTNYEQCVNQRCLATPSP